MSDYQAHANVTPVQFVGAFLVISAAVFFFLYLRKHGTVGLRTPVEHSDDDDCTADDLAYFRQLNRQQRIDNGKLPDGRHFYANGFDERTDEHVGPDHTGRRYLDAHKRK